jgi:hypothetical protein
VSRNARAGSIPAPGTKIDINPLTQISGFFVYTDFEGSSPKVVGLEKKAEI